MFLINEDFSDFPIGEFPYDSGATALGEYHCFINKGYYGSWYDPISLHQWRSMDGTWLIVNDNNKNYLEQNRGDFATGAFHNLYSVLVNKNHIFADYSISTYLTIFEVAHPCGIAINYITSRNLVFIGIAKDRLVVIRRLENEFTYLATKEIIFKEMMPYFIQADVKGSRLTVYLDGNKEIDIPFERIDDTRVAVTAKSACRYADFKVEMTDIEFKSHKDKVASEERRLANKRKLYPELKLIKKIDLKNFSGGRQIRVIERANDTPLLLLCQNQKRLYCDAFNRISAITAFDLDGNIIWQIGKAREMDLTSLMSCDMPIQVADINGDGKLEVIYAYDFMIYVVDALTGNLIKKMPTPVVADDNSVKAHPYYRLNVDAIRVADFQGRGYQGDIIIKDRYHKVWAIDIIEEKILWTYNHKNTGHFPYIYDFDNDGFDEMFCGYDMVDQEGTILWSLPFESDHTDEIIYFNLDETEKRLFLSSGDEGFNVFDSQGKLFSHNDVGHAQRVSIAKYDGYDDKYKVAVVSFWGSDGIVRIYDSKLQQISIKEQMSNGNIIAPVNYDGKHILCLLNASEDGGLADSSLDIVVKFPNDGHPYLSTFIYDIDGDGIDEIICWDLSSMWIYKASDFTSCAKTSKYPDDSLSNYMGEYLISGNDKK